MSTNPDRTASQVLLTTTDEDSVVVNVEDIVGVCTTFDESELWDVKVCREVAGEHICCHVIDEPEELFARIRAASAEFFGSPMPRDGWAF